MTEHECEVDGCNRPAPSWAVCSSCSALLERDLAEVPAYVTELDTTLSRQTAIGERSASKSAEKPLPYDARASEALAVLRSTLVGWVRLAVEEDDAAWPADTCEAMAAMLLGRLGWLRTHKAGAEAVDEITAAMGLVRRVVDRPMDKWFAGPCETENAGQVCDGLLYATPGSVSVICGKCGTEHDVAKRQAWLRDAVSDHLGTASEVSALCRHMLGELVTTAMIRGYVYRGSLVARGEIRDQNGLLVPIYKLGDIFTAAAKAGADPNSRRAARKASREAAKLSDPGGTHDANGVAC